MEKQLASFLNTPEMQRVIYKNIIEGIWLTDLNFMLIYANQAVLDHRGYSLEELRLLKVEEQLTQPSFLIVQQIIAKEITPSQIADAKYQFEKSLELEFLCKNGSIYWAEVTIALFRDDSGKAIGFLGVSRTIADRKRIENALIESEKRYRTLFEDFPLGLYQTTPSGRIINVNPAFVKMLRYPNKESLLSLKTNDLLVNPEDRKKQLHTLNHSNILLKSELQIRCKDGTILWVRDNAHSVKTTQGKIQYYEGSLEDITQLREAEEALKRSEERYRNLVENMGEGMTIVDANENILFANPAADRIFGVNENSLAGRNLREFLDPIQLSEVLLQTNRRKKGERSLYEITIMRPDGEKRILRITATAQYDDSGKFSNSFGVIHDVTDESKDQIALESVKAELDIRVRELENRNREIGALTDMVNMLQRCTTIPETFVVIESFIKQLIPEAKGALYLGKPGQQKYKLVRQWGMPAISKTEIVNEDCWALRREKYYSLTETLTGPLCSHLGKPIPLSTICVPIMIQNHGSGLLHLQTAQDGIRLTENHLRLANNFAEQINLALSNLQLQEELHEQAIRDSLTGLFNRYYMEETLEKEIARCKRNEKTISIMMLDFDNFKELNTIFGHPKADEALTTFGGLLNTSIRASDIACRYGGDEFLVIMPETSSDVLLQRADAIRNKVKNIHFHSAPNTSVVLTVSIGLAIFPKNGTTSNTLLTAVDKALLKAKKSHDTIIFAS
jgi:diguanylate cyclase (GGDEF)-like protein/PAS domain S-box-containing protein